MSLLAAIGLRLHSGWASAVLLAQDTRRDAVDLRLMARRRLTLCERAAAKQPYHAAENMALKEAEAFVSQCRDATIALAGQALAELRREAGAHVLAGLGLAASSARTLPALPDILRSHALIHAAEGSFYREALIEAARKAGVEVKMIKSGAISEFLGRSRGLRQMLDTIGKSAGPPWTMDEKAASLAAISLLPGAEKRFHLEQLEEGAQNGSGPPVPTE